MSNLVNTAQSYADSKAFDQVGTEAGELVTGKLNLRVVESRGGIFARNGGQFGGDNAAARRAPPDPQRRKRLSKGISLVKELDDNGDGKIQQAEWEKGGKSLSAADTNADAVVSLQEILAWLKLQEESDTPDEATPSK